MMHLHSLKIKDDASGNLNHLGVNARGVDAGGSAGEKKGGETEFSVLQSEGRKIMKRKEIGGGTWRG